MERWLVCDKCDKSVEYHLAVEYDLWGSLCLDCYHILIDMIDKAHDDLLITFFSKPNSWAASSSSLG
jgi:hypothetical protein